MTDARISLCFQGSHTIFFSTSSLFGPFPFPIFISFSSFSHFLSPRKQIFPLASVPAFGGWMDSCMHACMHATTPQIPPLPTLLYFDRAMLCVRSLASLNPARGCHLHNLHSHTLANRKILPFSFHSILPPSPNCALSRQESRREKKEGCYLNLIQTPLPHTTLIPISQCPTIHPSQSSKRRNAKSEQCNPVPEKKLMRGISRASH
ncbi:hypothetical protein BS50DRAFT_370918 [Corynespora cassiicola Philippines]|uniref:Uncharacterized protein n=1 Tax=Corynespora cassiicola Philippines TaxID=1448308 RepID=A0A2T2NMM6_CORCC|nr:hypothetical protein BS50DRAFT_370918 [Corynespora cassiicola Philippines]